MIREFNPNKALEVGTRPIHDPHLNTTTAFVNGARWQFGEDQQELETMLEILRWCAPQIPIPKEGDLRFEHSRRMYAGMKALMTINRKVKL